MNSNFPVLPDGTAVLLAILGLIAVVVYIAASAAEMRASRRGEKACIVRHPNPGQNANDKISDCYKSVAKADFDDRSYWLETAEQFKGGNGDGRIL